MSALRVLAVDDSVVARRVLARVLGTHPAISEVVTVGGGQRAVDRLSEIAPDVVVLDVEMPGMDGLATLHAIKTQRPKLPVVMFSAHTERGAHLTLEALRLGAVDYITKPTSFDRQAGTDVVTEQLLPLLLRLGAAARPGSVTRRVATGRRRPVAGPVRLIAVAASTGGPRALEAVLAALPPGLPCPVVVVQHMPATFTRLFAERLDSVTPLAVAEAGGGERPRPGQVWIAPGGRHLRVVKDQQGLRLDLTDTDPVNGCRPSADVLFESVAVATGAGSLAVVLTGMGSDGLAGCAALADAGAAVVAQDQASSVVWGMPGAVVRAGLADAVVPLERVAAELTVRLGQR